MNYYFMDLDPHLIGERNDQMLEEVRSVRLEEALSHDIGEQERKEKRTKFQNSVYLDRLEGTPAPLRSICYVVFGAGGHSSTSLLWPHQGEKRDRGEWKMETRRSTMNMHPTMVQPMAERLGDLRHYWAVRVALLALLLAVGSVLLAASPALASHLSFTGPTNFAAGSALQSVAVGDFNGDSHTPTSPSPTATRATSRCC